MFDIKRCRIFLLFCLILLSIYGIWRHIDYRLYLEDDLMWFYQMSTNIPTDVDTLEAVNNNYITYLDEQTDDGQWRQRAEVREELDKRKNYLAANIILFSTAKWIQKFTSFSPENDYVEYISASFITGFILQIIIVSIILFGIIFFVSDIKMLAVFVLALIYILLCDFFESSATQGFISQSSFERGPVYMVGSFVKMLFTPLMTFSPFYPPFKSRLVVFVLTAFILRWRDYRAAGYWCLLLGAFFHQGYGGIIIMFVIAIDIIKNPEIFRNFKILIPALLGIIFYFLRDGTIREALAVIHPYIIISALSVAILAFALLRKRLWTLRNILYVPLEKRINYNPIYTDVIVLAFLWFSSLLLFIPISLSVDPLSSSLLWGQVHGRLLGVLDFVIIFSLIYAAFEFFSKKFGSERLLKATLLITSFSVICCMSYAFVKFKTPHEVYNNVKTDFAKIDALSEETLPDFRGLAVADQFKMTHGELVESIVYYSLAKSKETGVAYHKALFYNRND